MRLRELFKKQTEDRHPNDKPYGPEFKPTMPAGTVKVDVSDVYDWYKLGMHISDLNGLGKHDFGEGPPSTILSFGSEEEEHEYIKGLQNIGLTTTDIDPVDPNQPKNMPRQKTDPRYNVESADLTEIERISPSGFEGGKEHLNREYDTGKIVKKLPGGSGLLYSIEKVDDEYKIRLWDAVNKGEFEPPEKPLKYDWISNREQNQRMARWEQRTRDMQAKFNRSPGKLIGELTVSQPYSFPLKSALQVGIITIDEDYRGVGLAKALYGIVLTIMKRPLLAGTSQTPGGRRNWLSISQIPGVVMKGYTRIDEYDLESRDTSDLGRASDKRYIQSQNKAVENRIDTIMGKLGGEYIGKSGGDHYFAFDVKPNTTKQELQAYIDTNLSKIYGNYNPDTGLYAVWAGK